MIVLISEGSITGFLPQTQGFLYGSLADKSPLIWTAIGLYFTNIFVIDFLQSIKGFIVTKVSLLCRTSRTKEILKLSYLHKVNNHTQRIQEDVKLSYFNRITVWSEYLVSGIILLQLIYININQPLLIIAAIVYAIISIIIALTFNKKLRDTEKEVQTAEADFRMNVPNLGNVLSHLNLANLATTKVAKVKMRYLIFTKLQLAIMMVIPFIVLVPLLLNGTMNLGQIMQYQSAFALLVVNAAILIQYYPVLIQGNASEERIREFDK